MDPRIITDYDPKDHKLTNEFLFNTNDWDLIEINYNIDIDKLQKWYDKFSIDFNHLLFNFDNDADKLDTDTSRQMVDDGYCGQYCGPIEGFTLAWTDEIYEPLPPTKQLNKEKYPNIDPDLFRNESRVLSKFRTGYLNYLINLTGEDAWRKSVITIHHPKMYIRQHLDSKDLKIHIPIYSNNKALFHFGKDRDRSYHMKVGKAYILNTADWHGTSNDTNDGYKIHILSRIKPSVMQQVLSLTNDN